MLQLLCYQYKNDLQFIKKNVNFLGYSKLMKKQNLFFFKFFLNIKLYEYFFFLQWQQNIKEIAFVNFIYLKYFFFKINIEDLSWITNLNIICSKLIYIIYIIYFFLNHFFYSLLKNILGLHKLKS